jgi:type II secretory pathway pseudopilin PulG
MFTKNIYLNIRESCNGLTILEMLMVIIISAVLLFTVVPKFTDTTALRAETAAQQMESYIRYVRALAMSIQAPSTAIFSSDAGGTYFVIRNQKYHIPPEITFTVSGSITFNSLGEPVPPIGTVRVEGITITVEPNTGKVKRL